MKLTRNIFGMTAAAFVAAGTFVHEARAVVITFETNQSYTTAGGNPANGNLANNAGTNIWNGPTTAGQDQIHVIANPHKTGANNSDQVISLIDQNDANTRLYRLFTPNIGTPTFNANTSVIEFGFQYLYDGFAPGSVATPLRFQIGDFGGGAQVMTFEFLNNGQINFNDGTTTNIKVKDGLGGVYTSSLDQWITVSGVLNYSTNTYTLFVNGVQQVGSGGGPDYNLDFQYTTNKQSTINLRAMGAVGASFSPILIDNITMQAIPEPASGALALAGLVGCLALRRGRQMAKC
jgi:hypothetical protein